VGLLHYGFEFLELLRPGADEVTAIPARIRDFRDLLFIIYGVGY